MNTKKGFDLLENVNNNSILDDGATIKPEPSEISEEVVAVVSSPDGTKTIIDKNGKRTTNESKTN